MGYSLELNLAIQSTDSNRILGRSWRAKHAIFDRVKEEVFIKSRGLAPAKPLEKFTISIERHSPRTLDFDNLIASLKPYIDALKISGIIKDDNWNFIKSIPVDQKISKAKQIIIRVKEHE